MLPNVKILIQNGALGGLIQFAEGITGIIGTGTAVSGKIGLGDPRTVYNLQDAINIGITQSANPDMYRHVKEFYDVAGNGAELNLMLVANTVTQTQMLDKTNTAGAVKLLDYATGRIRLLVSYFVPDTTVYVLSTTHGIDDDAYTACNNAQQLALAYALNQTPVRVLVEGRQFTGTPTALTDLNTLTNDRAGIVIGGTKNDKSCSVGLAIGMAASLPVQRKISRVKNKALPIDSAFISTTSVDAFSGIDAIHDKGFITIRKFPTLGGYFFSSDHMAASSTSDYFSLARGRVIDKASVLTYGTFVQEVDDDVILVAGGKLDTGVIAYLEAKITNQINLGMVASNECSGVQVYIDPEQNVASTNKITIVVKLLSVGYLGDIEVELGYTL